MDNKGPAEEHYKRQKLAEFLRMMADKADFIDIPFRSTVILGLHPDDFKKIMEETAKLIEDHITIEVEEHHTFAKPEEVNKLDFPNSSSEDK